MTGIHRKRSYEQCKLLAVLQPILPLCFSDAVTSTFPHSILGVRDGR